MKGTRQLSSSYFHTEGVLFTRDVLVLMLVLDVQSLHKIQNDTG